MTRHKPILEEIVRGADKILAAGTIDSCINVSYSGVQIIGSTQSYYCSDGWDGTERKISFLDLGMKPLTTYEQVVGMVFAIIETMSKTYPEWEMCPLNIEGNTIAFNDRKGTDGRGGEKIQIHYSKRQAPRVPTTAPKLKDW